MDIAIWILTILLTLIFTAAGIAKLTQGRQGFMAKMGPKARWPQEVTDGQFMAIGIVELLGAAGLILPKITGIAEFLSPLAAAGLCITMFLAFLLHVKIKDEAVNALPSSVFCSLSLLLLLLYSL